MLILVHSVLNTISLIISRDLERVNEILKTERRHLQSIFVFCTQNLLEIVILKCTLSVLPFQLGLKL